MLLDIEYKQETLLVRAGGELDLSVADNLRDQLEEYLNREPVRHNCFQPGRGIFFGQHRFGGIAWSL